MRGKEISSIAKSGKVGDLPEVPSRRITGVPTHVRLQGEASKLPSCEERGNRDAILRIFSNQQKATSDKNNPGVQLCNRPNPACRESEANYLIS